VSKNFLEYEPIDLASLAAAFLVLPILEELSFEGLVSPARHVHELREVW